MTTVRKSLSNTFQALSAHLEWAVAAFENAWQRGERPAINDYLKGAGANRLLVLIELVHADLDCQIRSGKPACVEDYLERFPELAQQREVVLGLIAAEYRARRQTGAAPDKAEYLRRFSQFGPKLAAWFQGSAAPDVTAAGTEAHT
jgi:hypothetical protein